MEFLSQANFFMQNGNSYKWSPAIDKEDKMIHHSTEVLVLGMPWDKWSIISK